MPGLLIKELPKRLHSLLRFRAKSHRRSLSSEVVVLLEEALDDSLEPPTLEEIDSLRVKGRRLLTARLVERASQADRP